MLEEKPPEIPPEGESSPEKHESKGTGEAGALREAEESAVRTELHLPARKVAAKPTNKEPARGGKHAREDGDQHKQSEPEVRVPRRAQRPSRVLAPLGSAAAPPAPEVGEQKDADRAAVTALPSWAHTRPAAPPPLDPSGQRAPVLPPQATPLLEYAENHSGLRATVLPAAAHLTFQSSDGDLSLHLRIKDGKADVRIGGSLAPMFETRVADAQAALASAGLGLGRFDLDQGGRGDQPPREPDDDSAPRRPTAAADPTNPKPAPPRRGRVHVKA
jgi:hypothetical protein